MALALSLALAAIQLLIVVRLLLNADMGADARLAWLVLTLFLPAVGAVLYLLLPAGSAGGSRTPEVS